MLSIHGKTRLFGLLGYPLTHTYSPAMHNRAFKVLGLDQVYLPLEVKEEHLGDVLRGLSKMNFGGFNVTIPHKVNVMKYLDDIDILAKNIGAVNTVTIDNGFLKGYNTDGIGFIRSLELEKGVSVEDKSVFILGSGGAAKSIAMTFAAKGARTIYLCNRTLDKAIDLADDINQKVRLCSYAIVMDQKEMKEGIKQSDFLINTTSVGMYPQHDKTPLNENLLHRKLIVCDNVYNPLKTRLLQEAEKAGCETLTGLGMLLHQGAEAFRLWTGLEPPLEAMAEALAEVSNA